MKMIVTSEMHIAIFHSLIIFIATYVNSINETIPAGEGEVSGYDTSLQNGRLLRDVR